MALESNSNNEMVRVQVDLLDNIMNYIGELVLIRNQFIQTVSDDYSEPKLHSLGQNLNSITNELQNDIMKTRMQPIGTILTKFHRIVADLATEIKKKINLELVGTETELDKNLIEAIKDPLIHIVRNALDHGIELPEQRIKVGKPEAGTLKIKAYHEGGQVIIAIEDDGKGLDKNLISKKALEKNLLTKDQLSSMSDNEIYNLIFAPGFSTAQQVSNISGRGVGMDVVLTNIDNIGGSIELNSKPGHGSTILLMIPLTLAIVPALFIKSSHELFAIPQSKIVELVGINTDDERFRIEWYHDRPIFRLRGKILPLVILDEVLNFSQTTLKENKAFKIVVLKSDNTLFGLIVDEVEDSADIVVKPLGGFLKKYATYSGATIRGDGSISLILDINNICEKEKLSVLAEEIDLKNSDLKSNETIVKEDFLLVNIHRLGLCAIPLKVINRIEKINSTKIDYKDDKQFIFYNDRIVPLVKISNKIQKENTSIDDKMDSPETHIIITSISEKLIGFIVDEVYDIVTNRNSVEEMSSSQKEIIGSFKHNDQFVLCLDIYYFAKDYIDESETNVEKKLTESLKQLNVIIAEDSGFYRNFLKKSLQPLCQSLTLFNHGGEAWDFLKTQENNHNIHLIITDIEMPNMNGFELTKKLRSLPQFEKTPIIAMTTRQSPADIAYSKEVGIDHHINKHEIKSLIENINTIIRRINSN